MNESDNHVVQPDLYAVKHSLRFYMTSSSGVQDLPEFMAFATFDDVKCGYCDSCGVFKAEEEWAIRFLQDNPQQREALVQECERFKYVLRSHFEELKQQTNRPDCLFMNTSVYAFVERNVFSSV